MKASQGRSASQLCTDRVVATATPGYMRLFRFHHHHHHHHPQKLAPRLSKCSVTWHGLWHFISPFSHISPQLLEGCCLPLCEPLNRCMDQVWPLLHRQAPRLMIAHDANQSWLCRDAVEGDTRLGQKFVCAGLKPQPTLRLSCETAACLRASCSRELSHSRNLSDASARDLVSPAPRPLAALLLRCATCISLRVVHCTAHQLARAIIETIMTYTYMTQGSYH